MVGVGGDPYLSLLLGEGRRKEKALELKSQEFIAFDSAK